MNRLTLRTRIFLSYFVIILLAWAALNWVVIEQVSSLTEDAFYAQFDGKTETLFLSIEDELDKQFETGNFDDDLLFQEIKETAVTLGINVMVIDPFGEVLLDTTANNHPFIPDAWEDVWILLETGESYPVEFEETGEIYQSHYLFDTESDLIIRVGDSYGNLYETIRNQTLAILAITAVIGLILLFALGSWLANALTRPLIRLQQNAQMMATGDLTVRASTDEPKEIANLATDFNQMANAVEQMVTEQKAFANNAAHELRTPLTAIRIRTETLLEDDPDPELTQQYVGEIDEEARRLSRLVDDLRILSRTDAHNLVIGDEQVDIGRLLAAIEQEFKAEIEMKKLTVTAVYSQDPIIVQSSLTHLRIIFRNLIENSIKYTEQYGEIQINLRQHNLQAIVTVIDNGIGIPPEDLPFLFNRFYRVDKAHSRSIPGSGLGLTLVDSLINLYKGTIKIESEGIGTGTAVTVTLPIDHQQSKF